jgi:hypothetical protein
MGNSRLKIVGALTGAAALLSLAQGCAFFNVSNPFLPSARVVVQPTATMIEVKYDYSIASRVILTTVPTEPDLEVSSYPNDGTPGVYFHSYSAEYLDMAGKNIPSVLLAKANFGVSAYLPPASSAKPSSIKLKLPIYNQQVRLYGQSLAYSFAGSVSLNPNFSHTINARVTLYGEDDNFNQVQYSLNVPIRFNANINQ